MLIALYYLFAALLIFLSYRSFRGGIAYYNFFKQELSRPVSSYTPFATVIAPCKGIDEGLEENLSALIGQEYPDFDIIFVVDSEDDPAVAVIKTVSRKVAKNAKENKVIVAGRSTRSSQKVENLREAVLHADERSEVFVFVDSDARVSSEWLRRLVAPLEEDSVGASTGYRWFISERMTLASEMRSAWNASIASALGPKLESNFCWGGSMAIRRDTFDQIDMRERWRGTLSDDFAVTRAMKNAGLSIVHIPQALVPSFGTCSPRELFEFTNRQMKITRVNAQHLWLLSYFGSTVFIGVMITSVLLAIFSGGFSRWAGVATFVMVSLFSVGKSWLRLNAVKLALEDRWPQVKRQWLSQNTLWLVTPLIFLVNCIAATLSRQVTWRGITYELKSPNETVIVTD
jgi:cellulose synthase/poly-beta-1,6-N-acetylglucosamine synthase-like glycosyltransferase